MRRLHLFLQMCLTGAFCMTSSGLITRGSLHAGPQDSDPAKRTDGKDVTTATTERELFPPAPTLKSSADLANYLRSMREMLDAGFNSRGDGLVVAEQKFQAAAQITDRDPRLNYAYGLVLLKRGKYDEALQQFDAATKRPDFFYPPAWQIVSHVRVTRKAIPAALENLLQFAVRLQTMSGSYPDEKMRQECAAWIGRLIGYLTSPVGLSKTDTESVARYDQKIRETLLDQHRAAYDLGKSRFDEEREKFLTAADTEREQALRKRTESDELEKQSIAEKQAQVEDQKEQLKMSAEKRKEGLDNELAACDRELASLNNKYQQLLAQGQSLSNSISLANGQIAQQELKGADPARGQLNQLVRQRNSLQARYNEIDAQAAAVKREAQGYLDRRNVAVTRYQRETGQLVKESESLRKYDKMLNQKDKALDKSKTPKTPPAKGADPRARLLTTYFPLNFEAEKTRVLSSFAEARMP